MADKKRLGDVVPNFAKTPELSKFGFYYYRAGTREVIPFAPVKLDKSLDTGYISEIPESTAELAAAPETEVNRLIWI